LTDQPIVFQGSAPINSWYTLSYSSFPITAVEALEYSSNAYMVQTALGIMGQTYTPNMVAATGQLETAMGKLRSTFGEYGLGASTGIDLPDESTGFTPKEFDLANYINNSFGQFDNYTPMQLAQYVATIANNGVRLAPHIVEGVYANNDQGGLGSLIQETATKELNKVNISESDMAILQQGFYQVSHGTRKRVLPKVTLMVVKKPIIPTQSPMHRPKILKLRSQSSFLITPTLQMVSDLRLHAILSIFTTNTIQ